MIHAVRKRFPSARRRNGDSGLSLVELIIAVVLSLTLIGVIVSAIITSLNIASATSDSIKTSVDVRLVSAYLARDAQGAAGTDPNTIQRPTETGVSVAAGDWNGCAQDGTLVARFSWIDRVTVSIQRRVTVTWALDGAELTRLYCEDGAEKSTLVLGKTLTSATARCLPAADCSGTPESIALTVAGRAEKNSYSTTLSASLRPRGQDFPTADTASTVRLLALGDRTKAAPCSTVSLNSTKVYVIGDAVVGDECGAGALSPGSASVSHPNVGVTSLAGNLLDPLAATPVPSASCSGSNPLPIGDSIGDPTVYPDAVVIGDGDIIDFEPGRYVFCNGLSVRAGATVTSSGGVFFYIKNGTLNIDPSASVALTGMSSGEHRNLLIWVATKQTVNIGTGAHITRLGGTIYAPTSSVVFNGGTDAAAINVGALVAQTVSVSTVGDVRPTAGTPTSTVPVIRFGPIPTLAITPDILPNAKSGDPYVQQMGLTGDVGELLNPRWSAAGLSPFKIDALTGEISGTAPCSTTLTPSIRVVDDSGLAVSRDYTLIVDSDIVMNNPGSYVKGKVNLTATLAETCNSPGTTVTIQYSLQGDLDANGDPIWQNMCTTAVKPFGCLWDTTAGAYENGATYDLRAVAVLGATGTTSTSEPVEGVTIDNGFPTVSLASPGTPPLRGTVTLVADANDGESGIARVIFEVSPTGLGAWMTVCNESQPADPVNQSIYECPWDTTAFVPGELGTVSYDIRAVALDRAGNGATSSQNNKAINNNGASVSLIDPGSYVRGTVNLEVNAYVPSPSYITGVTIEYRAPSGAWTAICTALADPWGCSWNTTGLTNGTSYELRATMTDSRNVPPAESAVISTIVDNSDFYAADVQTNNGRYERKNPDSTHPTYWYREKPGKPDGIDVITLRYSKAVNPNSIIPGWNGSSRTIVVRFLDGQFVSMASNTSAKIRDVMDLCTSWDTAAKTGMQCSGAGNGSNPNLGKGTGLGYVNLNADFVDGWDTNPNNRRSAILYGKISVSGGTVTIRLGDPCLPADRWWEGRYCTSGEARWRKSNGFAQDSPKNVKTPKVLGVMVWVPSATATSADSFASPCSTQPGIESGNPDRDF